MEQKKTIYILQNLMCLQNNPAEKVCINEYCLNKAVICADAQCSCTKNQHNQCTLYNLTNLIEQITSKKFDISHKAKSSFELIFKIYDEMIDKLSADRCEFQELMQMYGFKENTRDLIKCFNENRQKQITGSLVYKVKIEMQSGCNRFQNQQQLRATWQRQRILFQSIRNKLNNYLENRSFDSKIMNLVEEKRILGYFKHSQPIQQFRLLYRASQNQFKSRLFHAKCDKVSHTLAVIKTKNNIIIGGYTPLQWKSTQQQVQLCDPQKKTFIFCATSNKKIEFKSSKKASIMNFKKQGPSFGQGFQSHIMIGDRKFEDSSSKSEKYCELRQSGLITQMSQNSYKIKDYQVFQVVWRK